MAEGHEIPRALNRLGSLARLRTSVIVQRGSSVLLVYDSHYRGGCWIAPGGGVEFDENIIDGARREVSEETGLAVRLNRFWRMREVWEKDPDFVDGFVRKTLEIILTAEPMGTERAVVNTQLPRCRWVAVDQLDCPVEEQPVWLSQDLVSELKGGSLTTLPLDAVVTSPLLLDGIGPSGR